MSDRLVHRADLLVGVAIATLLVGPAAARGGLAGSAGAEVYGHAWVQAWASASWPAWPTGTSLAEGATAWAVIDPLPTWLVAGLARVVGATAAWNAWVAVGVVLAAAGGGAFARALGGSGPVGAIGVATMPIFLGSLTSGLTEDYALGLVALALAALLRDRRALGAALLGASAWCGLYLAWLGGLAALAIGLARLRKAPARWILAGVVAAAVAAPAALPFRDRLGGVGHRAGTFQPRPEPRWRLDPWRGADLASFVAPGKVDVEGAFVREHPVYLGYTTLGLAALGGWHPAWLGVLACAAVAPGESLSVAGQPLGVDNPAIAAFRLLPFAERFNHHARVMLLGQLVLVGLAARGFARRRGWVFGLLGQGGLRPPRNAPPVAASREAAEGTGAAPDRLDVLVALVLLAETAALSPARVPLPTASTTTPAIYAALSTFPAELPVVVVGAAGPGVHPQKVFFDQRAHGRRLLHNPNRPTDGRPRDGAVVVALGDAVPRVTAQLGPPDATAPDGAAWVTP